MTAPYPADRNRGASPTARAWAVARGSMPGSHYVVTEAWCDLRSRYDPSEIIARGLTLDAATERARVLNAPPVAQRP